MTRRKPITPSEAAAALGALGGAAGKGSSKRRDVDYAALGAKGGKAGKGKNKPRKPVSDLGRRVKGRKRRTK
jgi:hypothetical protein